jgi:beta-phosphoglucomutase-like phosphatase (HAD superfamily)
LSASPPKAQRLQSAPTSRNVSAAYFSKSLISKTISRRSRDVTLFLPSKPDPGHLTGTITLAGGDPSNALMIGDSDVDVMTAKAARVPIIGYAMTPLAELKAGTIDHFDQLHACAATLLGTAMKRHARS